MKFLSNAVSFQRYCSCQLRAVGHMFVQTVVVRMLDQLQISGPEAHTDQGGIVWNKCLCCSQQTFFDKSTYISAGFRVLFLYNWVWVFRNKKHWLLMYLVGKSQQCVNKT